MKIKIVLLIAIVFGFIFSSCKKEANQDEIDRGLIEQFAFDNQLDGTISTSGLYYIIEEEGSEIHPDPNSNVVVTFSKTTLEGEVIDQGEYFAEKLSDKSPGAQEGLQLIGENGKIYLIVPSRLAQRPDGKDEVSSDQIIIYKATLHYFTD